MSDNDGVVLASNERTALHVRTEVSCCSRILIACTPRLTPQVPTTSLLPPNVHSSAHQHWATSVAARSEPGLLADVQATLAAMGVSVEVGKTTPNGVVPVDIVATPASGTPAAVVADGPAHFDERNKRLPWSEVNCICLRIRPSERYICFHDPVV